MRQAEDITNRFAKNLHKLRLSKGLNQSQFAAGFGAKQNALSLYESGERVPPLKTIEHIARTYGTTVSFLLGESESPDGEDSFHYIGELGLNVAELKSRGLNISDLGLVTAGGDEMKDVIPRGSMVLIDKSKTKPISKSIYAIEWDGTPTFRYIQKELNGSFTVGSEQDENKLNLTAEEMSDITVLGKFVGLWRWAGN